MDLSSTYWNPKNNLTIALVLKNMGLQLKSYTKENKENGLGFFGYIIILLIIFLSAIGFIETFKENIIVFWPNVDNQLNFIYETFDNMTTIVKDILKSY